MNDQSPQLTEEKAKIFHFITIKMIISAKRKRPDINSAVLFTVTRTLIYTQEHWNKLVKLVSFLKRSRADVLTLEAYDTQTLSWYIDASFALHTYMGGYMGSYFTMGKGIVASHSIEQKVNCQSLTMAELVRVDDKISKVNKD